MFSFFKKWPTIGTFIQALASRSVSFRQAPLVVSIDTDKLVVESYPFEPASVYPSGVINVSEVKACWLNSYPPAVLLAEELIFIPGTQKDALEDWANHHAIPLVVGSSNWAWITEPFLDTEFSAEAQAATLRILAKRGISAEETARLQAEVASAMIRYNFSEMRWEWIHLGLFDVLEAMRTHYSGQKFAAFYPMAMEVERRGLSL